MHYVEYLLPTQTEKIAVVKQFLAGFGLKWEVGIDFTVVILECDEIVATGSLDGAILKCIAISPEHQGMDYTAILITELTKRAFAKGHDRLFLYTKPENENRFSQFGFGTIAKTKSVVWMENRKDGVNRYIQGIIHPDFAGKIGCIVANANPFTNGHLHLVRKACDVCDWVYLFIVSEEKSMFSFDERIMLAKSATRDISNLAVVPTDVYMVSSASFPTYFLPKDANPEKIECELDIAVFTEKIAKPLGITHRFLGEEPMSAVTNEYNNQLVQALPRAGIEVTVLPRFVQDGQVVSATTVRELYLARRYDELFVLVPESTYEYLLEKGKNNG